MHLLRLVTPTSILTSDDLCDPQLLGLVGLSCPPHHPFNPALPLSIVTATKVHPPQLRVVENQVKQVFGIDIILQLPWKHETMSHPLAALV